MVPLPSIMPPYERDPDLSGAENQAALYGVQRDLLYLASPSNMQSQEVELDQYRIHKYATLHILDKNDTRLVIPYDQQMVQVNQILDGGILWCNPPGIILINSQNYLFDGEEKDAVQNATGFLSHLICSIAHRVITNKIPKDISINFLETMYLDHAKEYKLQKRHVLIWGPLTEHSSSYEFHKTVQFLFSFRHYTRILLTSTSDVGSLLDNIKVRMNNVSYFFNFDVEQHTQEIATKKTNKKTTSTPSKKGRPKKQPPTPKHEVV